MQLPEDPANVQLLQELPNSDDAITVLPAAKQCGQKRKLEDLGPKDPDQFNKHFKARPHPSANRNQTWELGPLLVLPRRELSLSYLVPMQAVGDSKERSVYTSHVRLLEKRNPTWNPLKEPIVAVVEDVDTHTFYAFEMIESGTYAVCRLGSWVKLDSLRQSALWEREAQPMVRSRGKILGRTSSWQSGSQPARLQDHELDGKRRRVEASTRMEALMRRSSQHGEAAAAKPMDVAAIQPVESGVGPVLSAVSRDTLLDPNPLPRPNNSITSPVQSHPQAGSSVQMTSNALEAPPRKDPIEVHQELVQQYLSALYLSQASLVFFAKSALSRARASLKGGECILSDNLRTMLLSNKVADKKYKTSIPTVVKELPPSFAGSEPTSMTPDQTSKKPKKMSSRKPKLGRNGLYKDEAAFVEQWWQARSFQEYTVHSANPDQPSDSLTSSLRIRESQLQVLLCLEIMSLTAATSAVPRLANSTSELDSQILPILKDPLTILEMLLDRISIWQSLLVSLDQPAKDALDTASQDVEQASPATTMHQSQDTLRDFFHEVVQPL